MEKVKLPKSFVDVGTHAEIILRSRNGEERARALVDYEDVPLLSNYEWSLRDNRGYVASKERIALHRLITNAPRNKVVDHINRNPLDNRRSNLRVTTASVNVRNSRAKGKSGVQGVDERFPGKWRAQVWDGSRNIHLGYFSSSEEAVAIRKLYAEAFNLG